MRIRPGIVGAPRITLAGLFLAAIAIPLATPASARNSNGSWRQLNPAITAPETSGPAARRHATMVYDPTAARAIVYGGDDGTSDEMPPNVFGDVWELNLSCPDGRWTKLSPLPDASYGSPVARHGHVAIYVPSPPRMIVFGGRDEMDLFLSDTWELPLSGTLRWKRLSIDSLDVARYHSAAAYWNGVMYLHGGKTRHGTGMADLWSNALVSPCSWNHVSGCPLEFGSPCDLGTFCQTNCNTIADRRYHHTLTVDPSYGRLIAFGGDYEDVAVSNMWATSNGTSWTKLKDIPPGEFGRVRHTTIYDPLAYDFAAPSKRRLLTFGGEVDQSGGAKVSAVTAFDLATNEWSTMTPSGTGPGARSDHAAVYDSDRDRMVVFGGVNSTPSPRGDVWVLEFSDATDSTAPAAVGDFMISAVTSSSATFRWTAPGDDGAAGRACSYEIRRSTSAITDDASFAAGSLWGSPPVPLPSGQQNSFQMTGLAPGVMYWVALKTRDDTGNLSALSNVQCIQVSPYAVCEDPGGGYLRTDLPQEVAGPRFALRTVQPNPSPGTLDVSFSLSARGPARVELLDLAGRRVISRELGELGAGEHQVRLGEGRLFAPGYYVVRLSQGAQRQTRSVMVVR